MARVQMFGKKKAFPRAGAWTTVKGKLGVIFEVGESEAHVHLVDDSGDTTESVTVPVAELKQAPYSAIADHPRVAHLTPFQAASMGYALSDEQAGELTALERKRLGMKLTDEQAADAVIEESAERLAADQDAHRQRVIASHPDAIALEAQIEKERLAFVRDVEQRRTETANRILAGDKAGQKGRTPKGRGK